MNTIATDNYQLSSNMTSLQMNKLTLTTYQCEADYLRVFEQGRQRFEAITKHRQGAGVR